jgi:hypothetical protein
VFGFIREKIYSTIHPSIGGHQCVWFECFPWHHDCRPLVKFRPANTGGCPPAKPCGPFNAGLNIGSTAASQGAFTGIFQNRWTPSVNAVWNHGKHTITFGGSFSYTQLNARDKRTNTGMIGFTNFATFLTGSPITCTANGFISTDFLQGDADRYYRSKETGWYLQDKIQVRSSPSISAGLRFDHHGGLTEKMDAFSISIHHGTATTPHSRGLGHEYCRGELFTYLSPGFASGVIPGGPFGVNQSPPWVNSQACSPYAARCAAILRTLGLDARSKSLGKSRRSRYTQCEHNRNRPAPILVRRLQPCQ